MALILDRKDGQSVTLEWPSGERVDVAIEGDHLVVFERMFGKNRETGRYRIDSSVTGIGSDVTIACRPSKRAGYVAVRIDAPKSVLIFETERPRAAS